MAKAINKTFKIGERALGGNVKVNIQGTVIKLAFISTADGRELSTGTGETDDKNAYRKIMDFLENNLDAYNSEKIADFIVSKAEVEKKAFWED